MWLGADESCTLAAPAKKDFSQFGGAQKQKEYLCNLQQPAGKMTDQHCECICVFVCVSVYVGIHGLKNEDTRGRAVGSLEV